MQEIGLDLEQLKSRFENHHDQPYVLIEVSEEGVAELVDRLSEVGHRFYITDSRLEGRHLDTSLPRAELVASKLPDRGSVMSGDFGEILTAVYAAAREFPTQVLDPKRWRLKQDRTKAAPYSDVVQLILPLGPAGSPGDKLLCAEVKTKATSSNSTPISSAIADSLKDREGRLVKTLAWLRERALHEDLGTVGLPHLERFIKATDHPPAAHEFAAVAVISSEFVADETSTVDTLDLSGSKLIVISVPELKASYERVFDAFIERARTLDAGQ